MNQQRIVIDLEMNPVAANLKEIKKSLCREIIEIGAVKLNEKNEMISQFRCYVKPQYNKEIARHITNLTGIHTSDINNAMYLSTALDKLTEWIGTTVETKVYSWSDSDLHQIQMECYYKGLKIPDSLTDWHDFQKEYADLMGRDVCSKQQMSLHAAAAQFGIEMDCNNTHSALYDAEITTELLISFLNGEYIKQASLLRKTLSDQEDNTIYTLGDACNEVLQSLIMKFDMHAETTR